MSRTNLGPRCGPRVRRCVRSALGSETSRAFGSRGGTGTVASVAPEGALSYAVLTSGEPIRYPEATRPVGSLDGIASRIPMVTETDLAF